MKLSELKLNPKNPQKFGDLSKLENSIKELPQMMELRPLVYDSSTKYVIGGNKRLICLKNLGYKEIPDSWVRDADLLSEEEKERFVIADNVGFGEWDWDVLEVNWSVDDLSDWGLEINKKEKEEKVDGEVAFSEYIMESTNYIVLIFDNDLDWLNAQTHFELKSVYGKRANGKPWSKGIGRVINGADYLSKLNS